jgi:hypothetical protein
MAEKVGEIYYDVTLETGQMLDGSRKVRRELDGLTTAFTAAASAVAGLAAAMSIASVIRDSVNAARAYEKTLADLSAITGVAGEGLVRLSDEAKALARNSTASSGQVVEAMKLIASAKPELLNTAGALTAVTKEAIALAEASGMQLPAAAEAVTLALNQFGVGADQAARFVNVLAAGAKFGASEIADTAIALKNSAVSAAAAKVSFEETNAALQALAAGGIKGGEAGTSLRNVILKLENDTDKRLKPSIVGLAGALQALDAQNLSSAALTKMFGLENVNAAQALIGSAGAIRTLTGQLTGTNTAYEQAAINTDTYDAAIKRMSSSLEMAGQAIGNQLLPFLRQGAEAVQSLANSLSTGSEVMSKAMTVVEVGSALLAGMLAVRLVSAVQAVIASYTASAVAANAANAAALMLTGTTASLTAAQTALSVATGVAATAGRAFGAVMAGLGGPIGLAVAALVTIAWNWDVITGKANDAAATSERAAARIAAALKKSSESATADLQGQLVETQKAMALIDRELSMPRQLQSGRGMGGGRPLTDTRITELKEKRDALVKIAADIEKAMFRVAASDEGGGMVGPADTSPKKPVRAPGADAPAASKFDAEGYLAGLEKATLEGAARVDAIEREALRKNAELLEAGKISRAQAAQAVNLIEQEAAAQRLELQTKAEDELLASLARMEQAEADSAKRRGEQQAKDLAMAREIQLADDPIGRLQLELQTKSDMLTAAAERDRANEEIYAAARVALEEHTASAIASIHANTLAGYSSNLDAAAGLVEKFGGKQNALYKTLFAASKAFAIAESIIKIQQGIAGAAALPFPANIPAIGAVVAATSGIISTISGTNYGGGRLTGGPASAGSTYRINEAGAPEMFVGANGRQYMMPTQAGNVVPADGLGGSKAPTIIIQNTGTPQRVESQSYDSASNTATLVMADLVDQISNNSGPVWSALTSSSNVQGRL